MCTKRSLDKRAYPNGGGAKNTQAKVSNSSGLTATSSYPRGGALQIRSGKEIERVRKHKFRTPPS